MTKKKYFEVVNQFRNWVAEIILINGYHEKWINCAYTIFHAKFYAESVYHDLSKFDRYIAQGSRILDFGTGSGYMPIFYSDKAHRIDAIDYYNSNGVDDLTKTTPTAEVMVQQKQIWERISSAYPTVHFSHYSGNQLPFDEQAFDSVIAYAVLEHIPDVLVGNYLDEFNRILKRGGTVLVSYLPRKLAYMEHLARLLGLGYHDRLYGDKEFQRVMESHGFEKTAQGRKNLFPAYPAKVMNALFPVLKWLEPALLLTPLVFFAHNIWAVYHKVGNSPESIEN